MKNILKLAAFVVALVIGSAAFAADPAASIKFENKSYDFGSIPEDGGNVTCQFEYVNQGDAPLVIISANAGCGCTHPEFDSEPVAPGKTGVIKVSYNPIGRPGEFAKNVTVRTNDKKNKKIVLQISGVVIPANN